MSAPTFYILIFIWIGLAIVISPIALKIVAPYGRHTKEGWGPLIDNRLGWMIYEAPALILVTLYFLLGDAPNTDAVWIMFSLFILHYINRTIVFPLRIRTKGKKVPLGIVVSAFIFNITSVPI